MTMNCEYDSVGLNSQIQVTNFEAGGILTTLYIFPFNFGPSKATRMVKVPLESSCHSPSSEFLVCRAYLLYCLCMYIAFLDI